MKATKAPIAFGCRSYRLYKLPMVVQIRWKSGWRCRTRWFWGHFKKRKGDVAHAYPWSEYTCGVTVAWAVSSHELSKVSGHHTGDHTREIILMKLKPPWIHRVLVFISSSCTLSEYETHYGAWYMCETDEIDTKQTRMWNTTQVGHSNSALTCSSKHREMSPDHPIIQFRWDCTR